MADLERLRARMVRAHLERRGITDPKLLEAFRFVHREDFLPAGLAERSYEDTPLPLSDGQTISQPYVVALTVDALGLNGSERVLEVGTGSGYAAAILSRVAREVFTLKRLEGLATSAGDRLKRLGFDNVRVRNADGTLGWPEEAPFDAIAVAAGGPIASPALLKQLRVGGRLVIPLGPDEDSQVLTRITREAERSYRSEALTNVRFVPLIGDQGFSPEDARVIGAEARVRRDDDATRLIRASAEPLDSLDPMLDRIGDARVVLIGEASHGTEEFYRLRARITRELIERRGFNFVAVEADWPDAARIDDYVLAGPRRSSHDFIAFERFPAWMWRNQAVHDFSDWLRSFNREHPDRRVGFHGLDLYSLYTSIDAVLHYLDTVNPSAAAVARRRYGTLAPFEEDPQAYGSAVLMGRSPGAEAEVLAALSDLLAARGEYTRFDGERFFDATQNARLVADAERYYREMFYGSVASWNLRDTHMFETLKAVLEHYGAGAKAIVWEHNSHLGDASATEMAVRGEQNVGQLCRQELGEAAYLIGQSTDHGTVLAAHDWEGDGEIVAVRPGLERSYERLFHETGLASFALPLRGKRALRDALMPPLLERAIGVIYRPETERRSHYFEAMLPRQFDELLWTDETHALVALPRERASHLPGEVPETYPFGL